MLRKLKRIDTWDKLVMNSWDHNGPEGVTFWLRITVVVVVIVVIFCLQVFLIHCDILDITVH